MIRSLNPRAFQAYGDIVPIRGHLEKQVRKGAALLELSTGMSERYRARSPVRIVPEEGTVLLSVSLDGRNEACFRLDRAVLLPEGRSYSLRALSGFASVRSFSAIPPESLGSSQGAQLPTGRRWEGARVISFCLHKGEPGYLFPGELSQTAELLYVTAGALHQVVEGRDCLLQPGELALCGPRQWYMRYAELGVAPEYLTLSFDPGEVDLSRLYQRRHLATKGREPLLEQLLREQETADAWSRERVECLLKLLLLQLLKEAEDDSREEHPAEQASRSEHDIILRAQQVVAANLHQKLSVPIVARQVQVSPSYLTALFHKQLGIAPGEYIRRNKLQESKRLIGENRLNLVEIAGLLQYSTIAQFSRQFKDKFGITPSDYAKTLR